MEVRYLRIRVLHICKNESGRRTDFGAAVLVLLAKNMPEHFAGYYLLNSYNILTQEKLLIRG